MNRASWKHGFQLKSSASLPEGLRSAVAEDRMDTVKFGRGFCSRQYTLEREHVHERLLGRQSSNQVHKNWLRTFQDRTHVKATSWCHVYLMLTSSTEPSTMNLLTMDSNATICPPPLGAETVKSPLRYLIIEDVQNDGTWEQGEVQMSEHPVERARRYRVLDMLAPQFSRKCRYECNRGNDREWKGKAQSIRVSG